MSTTNPVFAAPSTGDMSLLPADVAESEHVTSTPSAPAPESDTTPIQVTVSAPVTVAPIVNVQPSAPPPMDAKKRLKSLLAIHERDRTDAQWDEIIELEIQLAPGNRVHGHGGENGGGSGGGGNGGGKSSRKNNHHPPAAAAGAAPAAATPKKRPRANNLRRMRAGKAPGTGGGVQG